jgi:prevent-host-death family protein
MDTVNIYEAKTQLSALVERAAGGEEIIIAKNGRAVARLVPLAKRTVPRPLGRFKGQFGVGKNFDAPLPAAVTKAFRGETE